MTPTFTGKVQPLGPNAKKAYPPCTICGEPPQYAVGIEDSEGNWGDYLLCSGCASLVPTNKWGSVQPTTEAPEIPAAALATLPPDYDHETYQYMLGPPKDGKGECWHPASRRWITTAYPTLPHEDLLFRVKRNQWEMGDGFYTDGGVLCQIFPERRDTVSVWRMDDLQRMGCFDSVLAAVIQYNNPERIPRAMLYELAAKGVYRV